MTRPHRSPGVTIFMLGPMASSLNQVSQAMCGGDTHFIWTVDKRGITLLAPTTNGSNASRSTFRSEQAINAAGGFAEAHVDFAVWMDDPSTMSDLQQLSLEAQIGIGNTGCGDLAADETMLNYLRDGYGDWTIQGCSDVVRYCNSVTTLPDWGVDAGRGFLARMLCSETCGCADPGGLFMFVQGCPYSTKHCLSSSSYQAKLREARPFCSFFGFSMGGFLR